MALQQSLIRIEHSGHRFGFVVMKATGFKITQSLALHDHLRASITAGFDQYRIHMHTGRYTTSISLYRLGATDFTAVGSDCTI